MASLTLQGIFWDVEPPKNSEPRVPPEAVWLKPDYLPGLAEARAFNVPMMSFDDMRQADAENHPLIFDIEIYRNYFLIAFMSKVTGKAMYIETRTTLDDAQIRQLEWILRQFTLISFNGIKFDSPILTLAMAGRTCGEMKHAADMLIQQEMQPWLVLKHFKLKGRKFDHVDLIEVCPLDTSLKGYAGRLHAPKLQDLPFPPDWALSEDQISILRFYCIKDLVNTGFLHHNLLEQLKIREELSTKYQVDLRSKSDAQIAEAVLKAEIKRLTGWEPERPEVPEGTSYPYKVPPFISFQTPALRDMLDMVRRCRFWIDETSTTGAILLPAELEDYTVKIGRGVYRMGIGGLHSSEKCISYKSDAHFAVVDRDVASYYPAIIINQLLHPLHLGFDFINVYKSIVARRLEAKKTKNKVEADMLKIVINGSFGKFGSKWSVLYAPDLLIQTTITGQLSLLMFIEALELNGIQVCSANTDGIVMRYPRVMQDTVDSVVKWWEGVTNFETEATEYKGLYCRDVNNYIAVKEDGKAKTKGAYSNPWNEPGAEIFRFHKNPVNTICVEAVIEYLKNGTPIAQTIRGCRALSKFLTVRTVKGGGVKDGVYLGKVVRWYMATNAGGEIVYAASGNKVPLSDGVKPCMDWPDQFPEDIDYARYEADAYEILAEIAAD